MFNRSNLSPRDRAQDLIWNAMDLLGRDNDKAVALCHEAVSVYPDCVDALILLAQAEEQTVKQYTDCLRAAVQAGRRDLGKDWFENQRGMFWGFHETRPFMRAMAALADGLSEWGTSEANEEAIAIYEEMLDLNPDDNQGVRDPLGGLYLQLKQYNKAAQLFEQYESNYSANPLWAKVLLLHATGDEKAAKNQLKLARKQNPHVELYLTGKKRRPRTRPGFYSPGNENEAILCVDMLSQAFKKHPKTKAWIKEQCGKS